MISKEIRDKIVAQSIQEIVFDRQHKQGKIRNWQKNEEMYYGKKQATIESRANVDLARMQEFVHTLLSKIKNPLVFKFTKRKESQLARVNRLNSLRQYDQQLDFWNIKDLAGKKQGIIYGRVVYSYHADSVNGYQAHLENVDVHDFLIDPAGGGIDIEQADNMGRYGIKLRRNELVAGVKSGLYLKDETNQLLAGTGNNTEKTQEEVNKTPRTTDQNTIGQKELQNADKFKFWEWFTTYGGVRYYLLMQENGTCIRLEKLTNLFSATKQFPLGAWPFWTWAAFLDLTEFWTPSYCDYVREIFMTQNVSINQMLDNAEAINKPQKVVNTGMIENLAELKYKKDGIIRTKGDYDASRAIQLLRPNSIQTPITVFELLEKIQEKALGVTSGAKGVSDEQGKVAIYQGNQEAAADRFGLLNVTYSFGYYRFAKLFEIGVRDNLTKKIAIDIIGPEGIETEEIGKSDVYHKGDDFGVLVEASNAEDLASAITQKMKLDFINGEIQIVSRVGKVYNPIINPQKAVEMKAKIVGFSEEDINELLDVDNFGTSKIMSEAARDIESILEGEDIKPNAYANNAYRQRLVNYARDHEEDMNDRQKTALLKYITDIEQVVIKNTSRALDKDVVNILNKNPNLQGGGAEVPGIPTNPAPNQTNETLPV